MTAAVIDSRDYITAKRRAETEIFLPEDGEVLPDAGCGEFEVIAELAHGRLAVASQVVKDQLSGRLHGRASKTVAIPVAAFMYSVRQQAGEFTGRRACGPSSLRAREPSSSIP